MAKSFGLLPYQLFCESSFAQGLGSKLIACRLIGFPMGSPYEMGAPAKKLMKFFMPLLELGELIPKYPSTHCFSKRF